MKNQNGQWILASEAGLGNMYFGQLAEDVQASVIFSRMAEAGSLPFTVELFNARLILHQSVPLALPNGSLSIQTLFKVMPFPCNPDGAHVVLKATSLIDVEGDAATKELLMLSLKECSAMEQAERERRSKIVQPGIAVVRS